MVSACQLPMNDVSISLLKLSAYVIYNLLFELRFSSFKSIVGSVLSQLECLEHFNMANTEEIPDTEETPK